MVPQTAPAKPRNVERRSTRLELAVPVLVYGWTPSGGDPFTEITKTLAINLYGGLLALTAPAEPSEILLVVNNKTGFERHCRVVSAERDLDGKWRVGVEFVRPEWQFWGLVYDIRNRVWRSAERASPSRNVA
jgi:hypothetical protein